VSRRLRNRGGVRWVLLPALPARNPPIYGPRTFLRCSPHIFGGRLFKGQRYLLRCDDFFLGMYLFWKAFYHLKQSPRYNQVLTGILPYHGSNQADMITEIRTGKRPSRPIDSGQSRLLQDPVWNVITTGWHHKPNQRCKLSVMYHVFQPPSQRRQLGKILPRIASFFQFLQNPESTIQRQVNEMNEVSPSTSPLHNADTIHSVSRVAHCRIERD